MKLLITESKRYQLVYKILDRELSMLHREDVDLNVDSIYSNQQILFKNDDGKIMMRWGENSSILYFSRELLSPLKIFSFDEEVLEALVKWWFKDRVRFEPYDVYFVSDAS